MQTRISLTVLFLFVFLFTARAQGWRSTPWEMQFGIGSGNYFGDIGGTSEDDNWHGLRDLDLSRSRPFIVSGLRYNHNRYISFAGTAIFGWLSGSDAGGRNEARDYVFSTFLFEPSGRVEFFTVKDYRIGSGVNRRGMVRNYATLSGYLFAGAGAVVYNVKPNENLLARQQRDGLKTGVVRVVVPAGLGVKFGIRNNLDLGIELGGRYVFGDLIDGFTSPASRSNDFYYITSLMMVYRLSDIGL